MHGEEKIPQASPLCASLERSWDMCCRPRHVLQQPPEEHLHLTSLFPVWRSEVNRQRYVRAGGGGHWERRPATERPSVCSGADFTNSFSGREAPRPRTRTRTISQRFGPLSHLVNLTFWISAGWRRERRLGGRWPSPSPKGFSAQRAAWTGTLDTGTPPPRRTFGRVAEREGDEGQRRGQSPGNRVTCTPVRVAGGQFNTLHVQI